MTAAAVSIDRTALSLSPLTISDDGTGTYSLTVGGLSRPVVTPRETKAPESRYFAGSELLAVTREQTSMHLEVLIQAASSSALDAAITALDNALWQFAYDVTVTVDGVAKVWHCTPAALGASSGLFESSHVADHFAVFALDIPCKPIPA